MPTKLSSEEYFNRLKKKWVDSDGNQMNDYSESIYNGMRQPLVYRCLKHGIQKQGAKVHLEIGCQECSNTRTLTLRKFIEKAKNIHKNPDGTPKYIYDRVKWINATTHVWIGCPNHNIPYYWPQTPSNHLKGENCPKCSRKKVADKLRMSPDEFIRRGKLIHTESDLSYHKVEYTGEDDKVIIFCNELDDNGNVHGDFEVIPRLFLIGKYKCPKCFNKNKSFGEQSLIDFIQSNVNCKIELKNREILSDKKELDIYISSKNIAIEYHGLYWHSTSWNDKTKDYHLKKTIGCEENGIQLIQIYEDEWYSKQEIIKSRLLNLLGKNKFIIGARKCKIKQVTVEEERIFLNNNHLQGYIASTICYGLYWLSPINNKEYLVALMSFGPLRKNLGSSNQEGHYELYRFVTAKNFSIPGGASRLFKHFIKKFNPKQIISFADRRWSTNINKNLYEQIGFKFDSYTEPGYFYLLHGKRVNRFSLRKDILITKYGCPENISEKEFCEKQNWPRIYDSGQLKYIWKQK